MKINKLTATFGKFNNESISFHDGLNVVFAPNESGKSTWCAFIKAMLYGVDSSERARAGYLPDKKHYAPWSGAPMEGTMELTADKCDMTISRSTRMQNAPMQDFSAVYTGTATPVKNINGSNCGEKLTGVSRDVFCRSAFVGQGASAVTGSPEMEKRIQSIISTGDEETSFSEAEERLLSWQRRRRFNRRGILPELDKKIDDATIQLKSANESAEKVAELKEKLDEATDKCIELEGAVTDARKSHRKAVIGGLTDARNRARLMQEKQNDALSELNDCKDEIRGSPFGPKDPEAVREKAERDLAEIEELSESGRKVSSVIPAIILFVLALAGAIVFNKYYRVLYVIAGAGICCAAALVFLFRFVSSRRKNQMADDRISAILKSYGAGSVEEISEKIEMHSMLYANLRKAAEKERKAANDANKAYDELQALEGKATRELDFVSGSSKAAALGRELSAQRARASKLSQTVAAEQSRLSMLGDPIVLGAEISCLKAERDAVQDEYDAIDLALDELRDADDEIQSRFSPQLGGIAAKYMSFLTGGKYENIFLDKDFSAKAKAKDDTVAHDSEYLSAGTVDLLYLAVRLAVCELALPDGEPCPLIIDDALVNLDDERYNQAMKLLSEIARERQVILFTCRQ